MTRILFLALALAVAAPAAPRHHPPRRAAMAAPAMAADDEGLTDWSQRPFSDQASHGVLWHQPQGLLAWRLDSAAAFGSLAAQPNKAKALVTVGLNFAVEGETGLRFAAVSATVRSGPTWAQESATDGALQAQAITLFSARDVVVAAVDLKNTGAVALRVRPILSLQREGDGLKAGVELSARYPALWLGLDRSAAAGRRLEDFVGVWMGAQSWRADSAGAGLEAQKPSGLAPGQPLNVQLTWTVPQLLRPGQLLRLPVLLAWGPDKAALQKVAVAQWQAEALPRGVAWKRVRARWAQAKAQWPVVAPAHQRLLRQAVLALEGERYGARAALSADALSAAKGQRDVFGCVETPLGALGLDELDPAAAEAAVMDLASFSAAAPAAVPPFTGEEKLQWDAAGLPLNGWVAWELYHRDPQPARAAAFLTRFGERLRNECAWWPPNRDGDGNGLYAFARDEEKPQYLRRQSPVVPVFFPTPTVPVGVALLAAPGGLSVTPVATPPPALQTWSLALTSLVAWQMQAAAVLADASGDHAGSEQFLALSQRSQAALRDQGWDAGKQAYGEGREGLWPLLLGLESDPQRAKQEIEGVLIPGLAGGPDTWAENGVWEPWRIYLCARTLAAYGYFDAETKLKAQFLDKMASLGAFPAEIGPEAVTPGVNAVASAAVTLEMLLGRDQQEVFLLPSTAEFESSWLQFRSLDGSFYMKRSKLPERSAAYAKIKVETPGHGPILQEKAFIFSSPEPLAIQIQSENGLDVSKMVAPKRLIFKNAHKVELLVAPRTRYLIRFEAEAPRK